MGFNKFKKVMRGMDIKDLEREIQERKKLLFKWNNPHEKMVETYSDYTGRVYYKTKHPFKKIRKELAILENILYARWKKKNDK